MWCSHTASCRTLADEMDVEALDSSSVESKDEMFVLRSVWFSGVSQEVQARVW